MSARDYRILVIERVDAANEIGPLDDGFLYYFPSGYGGLSAEVLRIIADELDRRNAGWNASIEAYFESQKGETNVVSEMDVWQEKEGGGTTASTTTLPADGDSNCK